MIAIDEADKMLSAAFQQVIEKIISTAMPKCQVMLFSATFPMFVKDFKDRFLKDPCVINLMDELTLHGVTQYYAFIEESKKVRCLNTLFSKVVAFYTRTAPGALTYSPSKASDQPIYHILQLHK